MYQTWITGTPARRHASARPFTFSTTFCSLACCGAPDSAKAPSIMTSFLQILDDQDGPAGVELQRLFEAYSTSQVM